MSDLFQKDLPLLIAAALSPVILGGMIVVLSSAHRTIPRGLVYLAGIWADILIVTLIVFPSVSAIGPGSSLAGKIGGSIDIALGAVLIIIGLVTLVRGLLRKPEEEERAEDRFKAEVEEAEGETVGAEVEEAERETVKTEVKEAKAAVRGLWATLFASMALMFANVPIWTFIIPVIKDTALANISAAQQVLFLVLVFVWVPLPAGELPLFLYAIGPDRAHRILDPIDRWVKRHETAILFAVAFVIGPYLLYKGVAAV